RAAIPIRVATTQSAEQTVAALPENAGRWAPVQDFAGKAGQLVLVPDGSGSIGHVLYGIGAGHGGLDAFEPGKLASLLPEGTYRFADETSHVRLAALGWLLESYRFDLYKACKAA